LRQRTGNKYGGDAQRRVHAHGDLPTFRHS
jgi:hypothetical protein